MPALLELPADRAPTAVIDFETTGLDPTAGHRVIEVAVVRGIPARPRSWELWSTLIDPQREVPARSTEIHGLRGEDLSEAPTFTRVLPALRERLHGAVIVAHNVDFDLGFLRAECARTGAAPPPLEPTICTLQMSRNLLALPKNNLTTLAERLGVPQQGAHRAALDAAVTMGVYAAMLRHLYKDQMPSVGGLQAEVAAHIRGGPVRQAVEATVLAAAAAGQDLVIDYTSATGRALVIRRTITIQRLRLPYVEAFCHLRHEERVFRIDRIQRAEAVG